MKPAFTFVTLQPKFSTSIFGTSWMTDLLPPGIVLIFVLSSNLILGNFSIVPLEHGILSFTMLAGFGRYSNKELLAKFDDSEFCSLLSMSVVTELTGVECCLVVFTQNFKIIIETFMLFVRIIPAEIRI